jgi:hypothetical protein
LSGTPAETQTAAPQPQTEQPIVVEQPSEVQPEQPAAAFNEPSQTDQPQPEAEQPSEQRTAAQPAQTPKARAAQPAKTPAPKKPVTVDDLINDN